MPAQRLQVSEEEANEYHISKEELDRINKLPYKLATQIRDLVFGSKWAIKNKNTSVVFVIDGRSGMGKTTLACQIGKYITEDFGLSNVYFTPEEFLQGLAEAKPETCHIFDEALLVSSRASMSVVNKMVIQAMAMIRSKRIVVILCANSIFDLDKNLALHRADVLFNVYGDSLTDRGKVMAFFKGVDGRDRIKELYLEGKKFYSYAKPKSNFNTTFSSYFVLNEDEYEQKKQRGVNLFLNKTGGARLIKYMTMITHAMIFLYEKEHMSETEISKIFKCHQSYVSKVILKYKLKEFNLGSIGVEAE